MSDKYYEVPEVPQTPSKNINNMLKTRCGHKFDSPVKYAIARWICAVFSLIVMVYEQVHKDKKRHSHTNWMLSCALVIAGALLTVFLGYHSVLSIIYAAYSIIYYLVVFVNTVTLFIGGLVKTVFKTAAIGLVLGTLALGVAGMTFFDKEGDTTPKDSAPKTTTGEAEKKEN